jgi:hypothetical protein
MGIEILVTDLGEYRCPSDLIGPDVVLKGESLYATRTRPRDADEQLANETVQALNRLDHLLAKRGKSLKDLRFD